MSNQFSARDSVEAINQETIEASFQASLFLGESIGFWVQTSAIILTAIFAICAVLSSRQMEKRKNAVDVIFNSKNDKALRKGIRTIRRLNADPNIEIHGLAYDSKEGQDTTSEVNRKADAVSINYVLNFYEYVAIGIKRGIYDEAILKDSSYTTIVHMYDFCKPYIETVRRINTRNTTWREFEWLARKWKSNPLKNHKDRS